MPTDSVSLPVRLPLPLNAAVRAKAAELRMPAASWMRMVVAERLELPEAAGRHARPVLADESGHTVGHTPSQALQHAAMLLASIGRLTDAVSAAGAADLADDVRATSRQVVACIAEMR